VIGCHGGWEGPPLVSRGNLPPLVYEFVGVRGTYPLFQGRIFHPFFLFFFSHNTLHVSNGYLPGIMGEKKKEEKRTMAVFYIV
jgi:hypothetical protein